MERVARFVVSLWRLLRRWWQGPLWPPEPDNENEEDTPWA